MIGTYYRLSLADEDVGADKAESNSIQGQRGLVEGYIMARPELAAEPRQEYVDDGYSGTSTSRPAFQRLIEDAQDGKVKTIIVKDFSRFARDYIEAGDYMERIFPLLGVRFISVNDGYDSGIQIRIIEFRPRLVVIDPIQAYLGSDSDLQIAGRARKLMRRLGMWAAGYDCAIVLIGHLNKKEGSKGLYRSLGSIDVVAAARSVLQVERDTENPDIRIVHQIKNSLAPTAEDIRFSISADKGFRWLECRPQLFEKQQPDTEPKFDTEQQKAAYWIKHFLEKGDMSANEIYCRLDNEGVSKRVARMVKTEMGIHCYQKKRRWYWSVQPEEGAVNGPQV